MKKKIAILMLAFTLAMSSQAHAGELGAGARDLWESVKGVVKKVVTAVKKGLNGTLTEEKKKENQGYMGNP